MINTSSAYRPFPTIRDVDFLVKFSVVDMNAKKESTVIDASDTGIIGEVRDTVNGAIEPSGCYAALERNLWLLDGKFDILPDDSAEVETGLWSNAISGADGAFESPPVIRYTFAEPLSTLGWTLRFDTKAGQYASCVRITAYAEDGVTVLDTGEYDNNSAVMAVQHYVEGYFAVEFEFLATNESYRRLRLVETDFGLTKYYDRNSIGSASIIYGADILSRSLPTRELVFTFDNSDKQYNLLNPDGVYQHLQEGQMIEASIRIGTETVEMGTFYFTKADVSQSGIVPQITAHDRIYRLDGRVFEGSNGATMTLYNALRIVLDGYDIPMSFGAGIADTLVTLSIPANTTIREAVRMLAQAAMCTVYINRAGVMRFEKLRQKADEDGTITSDELYDYSGVSIAEPVDGVNLTVASDFITEGLPGVYLVSFDDDEGNVTCIGNTLIVSDDGAGNVTASGEWLVTTDDGEGNVTFAVSDDYEEDTSEPEEGEVPEPVRYTFTSGGGMTISSFSNPCVYPLNGFAVAAWLLTGLRRRKQYAVKNRCDPAVEIGDTLRIDDIFGNRENAVITGIDIDYDGTLTAVTKGVGK